MPDMGIRGTALISRRPKPSTDLKKGPQRLSSDGRLTSYCSRLCLLGPLQMIASFTKVNVLRWLAKSRRMYAASLKGPWQMVQPARTVICCSRTTGARAPRKEFGGDQDHKKRSARARPPESRRAQKMRAGIMVKVPAGWQPTPGSGGDFPLHLFFIALTFHRIRQQREFSSSVQVPDSYASLVAPFISSARRLEPPLFRRRNCAPFHVPEAQPGVCVASASTWWAAYYRHQIAACSVSNRHRVRTSSGSVAFECRVGG